MSQNEKYTLLLMRDDSSVRRVRLSRSWLKFLFVVLLLIVVCGGISIWQGSRLWFENRELQAQAQDLRGQNALMLVRLDRLSTVERILQNTDPKEVNDLLSMISTRRDSGAAPDHPVDTILPPTPPETPENVAESPGSAGSPAVEGAVPENPVPEELVPQIPPPELVDNGKLALEKLLARPIQSDSRIELSYNMVNLDTANRVGGRLHLFIMTADNALYQLNLPPATSLYSMTTRKIVPRFTLPLPEQAQGGAAKALVAEMLLNDTLSLRQVYELPVVPEE